MRINMAKSKIVKVNQKIAKGVFNGYKKMEEGVVGGYKKIEDGAVGGFGKISDLFVDSFLTKENETVEEAHKRLAAEQKVRNDASKKGREDREAKQRAVMEENRQRSMRKAEIGRAHV